MTVNRRLVAVVVADVVGYSRLMERDEAGTIERVRALRAELIDPKIAGHGGRIVKTAGDGLLLEFPSATSALRCTIEVQREMGARNQPFPADQRIDFRIGVNLGDIVIDGDDILGDGVNVAARLEALAPAGGILIASSVREQVREDLGVGYADAGNQRVKNIARPVHVYRILLGEGLDRGRVGFLGLRRYGGLQPAWVRRGGIVAGIVVVAVVAVLVARGTLRLGPDKVSEPPSLYAVMIAPFAVAGDDPALAAAAPQLTADLTKAIGDGVRWARVTAPGIAAKIAAGSKDPRAMGKEAAVRFVIEADLRPEGERNIAFAIRVYDTVEGRQVSSTNRVVERPEGDDWRPLVRQFATATRNVLSQVVYSREADANSSKPSGRELLARVSLLDFRSDPERAVKEQGRLLDEAIRVDPRLARAWSERAMYRASFLDDLDITPDWDKVVAEVSADSLHATELDPYDPVIWMQRGYLLARTGSIVAAYAALQRAIDLDPTQIGPLGTRAYVARIEGEPAESLRYLDIARKAGGVTSTTQEVMACAAHVGMGAYLAAIPECERGKAGDDSSFVFANLVAAYALSGNVAKAAQAKAELLKNEPKFTIGGYEAHRYHPTPKGIAMDRAHLIAGMRKAGVPE
jgi:adenylate cyclase